jgi:hypothetical protein
MKKPRLKQSYILRCKNYMQWLPSQDSGIHNMFRLDRSLPDSAPGDLDAVEAMFMQETHGGEYECNQPYLYDCLKKGKTSREFHVKGWLSMTRSGEAIPEEFFGSLGLRSAEEFRSIFGRSLTLPLLRIIHRDRGRILGLSGRECSSSMNFASAI